MPSNQIRLIIKALQEFAERKVKGLTLDLTTILLQTTPIDTGFARANWIPSIGVDNQNLAGTKAQADAGTLDRAPQQNGLAEVATSYTLGQGRVYVSNNVPYITRLNDGSSQQAPAGFVQDAILRAVALAEVKP